MHRCSGWAGVALVRGQGVASVTATKEATAVTVTAATVKSVMVTVTAMATDTGDIHTTTTATSTAAADDAGTIRDRDGIAGEDLEYIF